MRLSLATIPLAETRCRTNWRKWSCDLGRLGRMRMEPCTMRLGYAARSPQSSGTSYGVEGSCCRFMMWRPLHCCRFWWTHSRIQVMSVFHLFLTFSFVSSAFDYSFFCPARTSFSSTCISQCGLPLPFVVNTTTVFSGAECPVIPHNLDH